jgi:hypothetical protein
LKTFGWKEFHLVACVRRAEDDHTDRHPYRRSKNQLRPMLRPRATGALEFCRQRGRAVQAPLRRAAPGDCRSSS